MLESVGLASLSARNIPKCWCGDAYFSPNMEMVRVGCRYHVNGKMRSCKENGEAAVLVIRGWMYRDALWVLLLSGVATLESSKSGSFA